LVDNLSETSPSGLLTGVLPDLLKWGHFHFENNLSPDHLTISHSRVPALSCCLSFGTYPSATEPSASCRLDMGVKAPVGDGSRPAAATAQNDDNWQDERDPKKRKAIQDRLAQRARRMYSHPQPQCTEGRKSADSRGGRSKTCPIPIIIEAEKRRADNETDEARSQANTNESNPYRRF
jgi:hypothetical protein